MLPAHPHHFKAQSLLNETGSATLRRADLLRKLTMSSCAMPGT
jgi:hypothetical protein